MSVPQDPHTLTKALRHWANAQNVDTEGIVNVSYIATFIEDLAQDMNILASTRRAQLSTVMTEEANNQEGPKTCSRCNNNVNHLTVHYKCLEESCTYCATHCATCKDIWACSNCKDDSNCYCGNAQKMQGLSAKRWQNMVNIRAGPLES
eukprot:14117117-Ditylum_brightwellii.AAC.1